MLFDPAKLDSRELYRRWEVMCRYAHRLRTAKLNQERLEKEMERREEFDWTLDEHDQLVPILSREQ